MESRATEGKGLYVRFWHVSKQQNEKVRDFTEEIRKVLVPSEGGGYRLVQNKDLPTRVYPRCALPI